MKWIGTEFMISDIGTKQTPGPRHTFLMELIHIKSEGSAKSDPRGVLESWFRATKLLLV
jgi:hypothetical protein